MKPLLGLRDPVFALTLLAIDPGLGGVMIAGPPGTGKTLVARAGRAFWPPEVPFVDVPLGVTLDRLLGGLNLWQTRRKGTQISQPGLLAQAHKGVVYVDEINLLDSTLLSVILQTMDRGEVMLEREGISQRFPARFCLIGTYDPREGELPSLLRERVAFHVSTRTLRDGETRYFIARHAARRLVLPRDMIAAVEHARRLLPRVTISSKQVQEICAIATRTGVPGNRAEVFAVRCARANAALHRRPMVTQGDVDLAVRLIFLPRGGGRSLPAADWMNGPVQAHLASRNHPPEAASTSRENGNEKNAFDDRTAGQESSDPLTGSSQAGTPGKAAVSPQPLAFVSEGNEVLPLNIPMPEVPASGSGRVSGRHATGLNWDRGRHIRSVIGDGSRGRIDVLATLRRAALRGEQPVSGTHDRKIEIRPRDICIKQFRRRSGLLIVFAAKQAAIRLLKEAYVYRDKIALINFCRTEAQLLLPPGWGLARATRVLKQMPAGGRTPLPSAFLKVWELAGQAPARWNVAGTVLVLITDGRGNEPLIPQKDHQKKRLRASQEARQLALQLRRRLVASLVIDTRKIYAPDGNARQLANALGAQYLFLPEVQPETITSWVKSELKSLR